MKCSHCGHENPTEYGFCGMCGKTLRQPSPLRPAEMEEPAPVYLPDLRERGAPVARQVTESAPSATSISGPSFLGLGDQTSAPEFSYLLEDEPSRGPGVFCSLWSLFWRLPGWVGGKSSDTAEMPG